MFKKLTLLTTVLAVLLSGQIAFAQNSNGPNTTSLRESPKVQEALQKAETRLVQIKQQVEARKITVKNDVCLRNRQRIQDSFPKLKNSSTTIKNTIDTMYSRVQGFYSSKQLEMTNYEELNNNVSVAQADAEILVTEVQSYNLQLDCGNPDMGKNLDGYRSVVNSAKDSLKSYRKALVELISSMRSVSAQKDVTTDGVKNEE